MGEDRKLKIGSNEIPWPGWATNVLAVVVLIAAVVGGGAWAWDKWGGKSDGIVISAAERLQLTLAAQHFGETPVVDVAAYNDVRGELRTVEFADGAAAMIRRVGTGPRQTVWMADPSKLAPPPPERADVPVPSGLTASPAFAGGGCWPNHPGRWRDAAAGRLNECWLEIHRQFEDGCVASYRFNSCGGYPETDQYGNIAFRWIRCQH